jgi:hypothetical protein
MKYGMEMMMFILLLLPLYIEAQVITKVAGNGSQGFCGDEGPATAAKLFLPGGIAVDVSGNVYISDEENRRVYS